MRGRLTRKLAAMVLGSSIVLISGFAITQSAILNNSELRKLGATASTAMQHRRLAAHYHMRAAEHQGDASAHDAIAKMAESRTSDTEASQLAAEATHYAQHSREAAEVAERLARLHEEMAARSER